MMTDTEEKHQQSPSPEHPEQDANAYQEDDEHSDAEVITPTEKVGCTFSHYTLIAISRRLSYIFR